MPKLANPVHYEPSLEGLNVIRPLQLADVNKIVIPTPVLCTNPPSVTKPAVGILARCTQNGALIKSNNTLCDKIYEAEIYTGDESEFVTYTFPTKVQGVLAKISYVEEDVYDWWCSDYGLQKYVEIFYSVWSFLPFVGKKIHFLLECAESFETTILLIGFYK